MISICCSITVQYEAALLGELSFKAPGLNLLLQALIPSSRVIDSTLPVCLTSITSFAETNKPGSLYKWVLLISSGTFRNLHRIAASRKATRYFQAEAPSHLPLSILWRGGGGELPNCLSASGTGGSPTCRRLVSLAGTGPVPSSRQPWFAKPLVFPFNAPPEGGLSSYST